FRPRPARKFPPATPLSPVREPPPSPVASAPVPPPRPLLPAPMWPRARQAPTAKRPVPGAVGAARSPPLRAARFRSRRARLARLATPPWPLRAPSPSRAARARARLCRRDQPAPIGCRAPQARPATPPAPREDGRGRPPCPGVARALPRRGRRLRLGPKPRPISPATALRPLPAVRLPGFSTQPWLPPALTEILSARPAGFAPGSPWLAPPPR